MEERGEKSTPHLSKISRHAGMRQSFRSIDPIFSKQVSLRGRRSECAIGKGEEEEEDGDQS